MKCVCIFFLHPGVYCLNLCQMCVACLRATFRSWMIRSLETSVFVLISRYEYLEYFRFSSSSIYRPIGKTTLISYLHLYSVTTLMYVPPFFVLFHLITRTRVNTMRIQRMEEAMGTMAAAIMIDDMMIAGEMVTTKLPCCCVFRLEVKKMELGVCTWQLPIVEFVVDRPPCRVLGRPVDDTYLHCCPLLF